MLLALLPACNSLNKFGATLPTISLVLAVDFGFDDLLPAAESEAVVL